MFSLTKSQVWPIARLVVSPSRACASTFRNMALLHILIVWLISTGMCISWATDTCVVTRTVKRCSSAEVHLFSICYCPHCETNLGFASPIDAGSLCSLPHSSMRPSVLVFCQNSSPHWFRQYTIDDMTNCMANSSRWCSTEVKVVHCLASGQWQPYLGHSVTGVAMLALSQVPSTLQSSMICWLKSLPLQYANWLLHMWHWSEERTAAWWISSVLWAFAFPAVFLACTIICTTTFIVEGSLVGKSIVWMPSENLYLVGLRQENNITTLLEDGTRWENWVIFVARSSLKSTKLLKILGAANLSFKVFEKSAAMVCTWYFCLRDSER